MLISTKGRYAVRIMIDLAENSDGEYVAMKNVAERQGISLKYIERIVPLLTKAELIEGVHGKGGGYRLCREPNSITVSDIVTAAEGSIAPVACLVSGAKPCERKNVCRTVKMWQGAYELLENYFKGITIYDLMEKGDFDRNQVESKKETRGLDVWQL
ncbi:MAG: Rrf2 family transcriptional regulator [Clostridia bacterium]|nr:Rrf2 family transcriptional regulator [Clostridia bacterium]MBQ7751381.1 Rrf2 family transcriptional regulator [Clostridia bacterium]